MDGVRLMNPGSLTNPRDGSSGSYGIAVAEKNSLACTIHYCGESAAPKKKARGGFLRGIMNFISDGIYEGLIRKKSERKAYLRGLFLGAGTMTNPDNQYLFEIVCTSDKLASDVRKLINSFTDIHAKKVQRKKEYVTYVKNSGQILDILAIMGAHSQYFVYEDVIMSI